MASLLAFSGGTPVVNAEVILPNFPGGYQVTTADIDGDGREDILALGFGRILWLQSPDWHPRTVVEEATTDNINLTLYDFIGDGRPEIVLASQFSMEHRGTGGRVQWLHQGADLDSPWTIGGVVDQEPTAHRLRWLDAEGTGRPLLVNAPIMGPGTSSPFYDQAGARLSLYRIPEDPEEEWPKSLLDDTLPVIHDLHVTRWEGQEREALLTASGEGVHLFQFQGAGRELRWNRLHLGAGNQSHPSARGSSEVASGHLRDGRRFLATIEPWHGDQVVLYLEDTSPGTWERKVLDESSVEGHGLLIADFDGDGDEEIVAGFRGEKPGIFLFQQIPGMKEWERIEVDATFVCQGLASIQLTDQERPALLAIGEELRLYRDLSAFGRSARK